MGQVRERTCNECGKSFKTKANSQATCDYCFLDEYREDSGLKQSELYKDIQTECERLLKETQCKSGKERSDFLMDYWREITGEVNLADLGVNWNKYKQYVYLFEFPKELWLSKREFDVVFRKQSLLLFRDCKHCQKEFRLKLNNQIFCSRACNAQHKSKGGASCK